MKVALIRFIDSKRVTPRLSTERNRLVTEVDPVGVAKAFLISLTQKGRAHEK